MTGSGDGRSPLDLLPPRGGPRRDERGSLLVAAGRRLSGASGGPAPRLIGAVGAVARWATGCGGQAERAPAPPNGNLVVGVAGLPAARPRPGHWTWPGSATGHRTCCISPTVACPTRGLSGRRPGPERPGGSLRAGGHARVTACRGAPALRPARRPPRQASRTGRRPGCPQSGRPDRRLLHGLAVRPGRPVAASGRPRGHARHPAQGRRHGHHADPPADDGQRSLAAPSTWSRSPSGSASPLRSDSVVLGELSEVSSSCASSARWDRAADRDRGRVRRGRHTPPAGRRVGGPQNCTTHGGILRDARTRQAVLASLADRPPSAQPGQRRVPAVRRERHRAGRG